MGLSIAVSGAIVMAALMYVLISMPGLVDSIYSVNEVSSEVSTLEGSIIQTDITLDFLAADSTSDYINFTVNNVGKEKLWNFDDFDLIITFDDPTIRLTEKLSYEGNCVGDVPSAAGNWCIQVISNDILDPGILNSGESMDVRTQVSTQLDPGIAIVLVVTDNGVVATSSKSVT